MAFSVINSQTSHISVITHPSWLAIYTRGGVLFEIHTTGKLKLASNLLILFNFTLKRSDYRKMAAAASEEKSVQIEIQGGDDVDQGRGKDEKSVPVISSSDPVEGKVISCNTVDKWKEQIKHGLESKKPVVIYFTASWCPPCRMIGPAFIDIAKKIPDAIFLKVDVDELQVVAGEYDVEAMPTFVFLKEGKEVGERVVGANKDGLARAITKHCSSSSS